MLTQILLLQLQWEDSLSEKYPHIVYEERSKAIDVDKTEQDLDISRDSDVLEGNDLNYFFRIEILIDDILG